MIRDDNPFIMSAMTAASFPRGRRVLVALAALLYAACVAIPDARAGNASPISTPLRSNFLTLLLAYPAT